MKPHTKHWRCQESEYFMFALFFDGKTLRSKESFEILINQLTEDGMQERNGRKRTENGVF